MKNEITLLNEIDIKNKIYTIRGKEVMLDSDLAYLYNCKNGTKTLNQAVNRHLDRFPADFYFQLNDEELMNLWSQIGTANKNINKVRTNPHVFTEQGVAMLATILRTDVATDISIKIMKAFVLMKHYVLNNNHEKELIAIQNKIFEHDNKLIEYDSKFDILFNKFKEKKNYIFFDGQYYDSYSLLLDIFNKAKNELIIIDNYIDKNILDLICNLNINIIAISKNMNNDHIIKYQKQYNNLIIINNDKFHDRFIIIDKKELYHIGSSIKDIGKKCFSINKIEDIDILNNLLDKMIKEVLFT